jgi:hypothetical protein
MYVIILVAICVVVVLLAAYETLRAHRERYERARLYSSLVDRINRGEDVSPEEYVILSPPDRAALDLLQFTAKSILRQSASADPDTVLGSSQRAAFPITQVLDLSIKKQSESASPDSMPDQLPNHEQPSSRPATRRVRAVPNMPDSLLIE